MADITLSGRTDPLGTVLTIGDAVGDTTEGSVRFPILLGKNGGLGFQYEGGVITVVATNPKVNVSFDRPMTYNGSHTHNPTGPFDIGTPALAIDALSIDIPITVNPTPASTNMTIYFTADGEPHGP